MKDCFSWFGKRCPVACPHKMPREEAHFILGHPKKGHNHSYITAEEAAGIGILTVILGSLLLIGCWYCGRRSGYRSLRDKSIHAGTQSTLTGRCPCEGFGHQDSKLPFQENNCEPVILEILKLRMCYPLILLDSTGTDRVYHNGLKNRLWSQITVKLYDLGQGS
ncbi:melanoma antigen recognized by T-cells 1 isoform X5 [Ursus maritimus]|uniref:Melanoma antigen recognized by T-cells 1 isoform X5 n=2 Tax=Ursus maritimus TaxID=29073 RepID=A0A8M1FXZ9_URSMA|nr:melanoma antigen recognized by T-cells 1 isoform X5 [Ursus maritimus]XP_057169399.1 melanoma antigen recognized by T-cells 1 isoform X4 [Ursus arctos]